MIIFVNDKGIIRAVGTNDTGEELIEIEVNDGTFDHWTKDKLLCYKCRVQDGCVIMLTPALDSRFIEHFDVGGKDHTENSEGIYDVAELAGENSEAAYDLAEYISQLEEMINNLDERVTALEEKEA